MIVVDLSQRVLDATKSREKDYYEGNQNWAVHPEDRFAQFIYIMISSRFLGGLCHPLPSAILFAYRYEWILQTAILLTYVLLNLVANAPGCDRYRLNLGVI